MYVLFFLPLSLSFLFRFFFFYFIFPSVLFFSLFPFLSFYSFFFLCFPIDLSLSSVCVVISTTCNVYVVVFSGWHAVKPVFQTRVVRRSVMSRGAGKV